MINLREIFDSATSWFVVTVLGCALWLIRRILTNQKEIEALKAELKARSERDEALESERKIFRATEMQGINARLDRIDTKLDAITMRKD